MAQAFANFYVITTRPDPGTVRRVNVMKPPMIDGTGALLAAGCRAPASLS